MPIGVPVAGFEQKYEIWSDGRVFNKATNQYQEGHIGSRGYRMLMLCLNGVKKQVSLHQLVAKHFLPNPYDHVVVNHKNGNKLDNTLENLEWTDIKGNNYHALKTGLRKGYMPLDEKTTLLERVLNGELIRDLAVEVGRREETLSGMLRRTADKLGKRPEWDTEMKRRRVNVAIRNLEKVNA